MEENTQGIYFMTLKEYPDVMNVKQVGKLLGLSAQTVYNLISDGALPAFKVGRSLRISKLLLMKYMKIFGSTSATHHT